MRAQCSDPHGSPPPPSHAHARPHTHARARSPTGIVIGILLGIANCYFLWLLLGNAGVDVLPAGLASMLPASFTGCGGGASKSAGYYSAASSGSNANAGAYAAAAYAPPSGGPDL